MGKRTEPTAELRALVEFAPGLEHFLETTGEDSFEDSLIQFTNQLTTSLALPIQLSIQIGINPEILPSNPLRITIGEQLCRLPMTRAPQGGTSRDLAKFIAEVICENRELCLPVSVSEQLLKDWFAEQSNDAYPGPTIDEFHGCLLKLMRRGFKIDRYKNGLEQKPLAQDSEGLVDRSISGSNAVALKIFLGQSQVPARADASDAGPTQAVDQPIALQIGKMQDDLFYELGVFSPDVRFALGDALKEDEFQLQINDLLMPPGNGLKADESLVADTVERLKLLSVSGTERVNPDNGQKCAIVQGEDAAAVCRSAGLTVWGPPGYALLHLKKEISRNAGALLTVDVVEFMMAQVAQSYPALANTISIRFNVVELAAILRGLQDEEISIRDLRGILEGLLAITGTTNEDLSKLIVFFPYTVNLCQLPATSTDTRLDPGEYANYVRTFMKKYISHKYTRGQSTLLVYLLDSELENRLSLSLNQPLDRQEYNKLLEAILTETQSPQSGTIVILTTIEIRRLLRKLIEKEFPSLPVLSYQELSPELNIQPLGRISWN